MCVYKPCLYICVCVCVCAGSNEQNKLTNKIKPEVMDAWS